MCAKAVFREREAFLSKVQGGYRLLPFRFARLPEPVGTVLLTNDAGDWTTIAASELTDLVQHRLAPCSAAYEKLRSRGFIATAYDVPQLDLQAARIRTRKSFIVEGPTLVIFVVTLRCAQSCMYCQVSRRRASELNFDMSPATITQAVDRLFELPSQQPTVEFQGGEPSLAFDVVRRIIETIAIRNREHGRHIRFTMVSTLEHIDDDALAFCREHKIALSTSVDGPRELHNANRPHPSGDSYGLTLGGLSRARAALGADQISALVTVTRKSLSQPEDIVDSYIDLGFTSIFLRPLSPYGFALRAWRRIGYTMDEYLGFYRRALAHVIRRNLEGCILVEAYTAILLRHILTPFPTGYMDLRSPAGAGLGTIVFNFDGQVYVSDEGRMAAETGDDRFCLGSVAAPIHDLRRSDAMQWLATGSIAEALPGCADCAFLPYCGADPVFHAHRQGDPIGHRPTSDFCRKHMGLFRILFAYLTAGDPDVMRVFMAWLSGRSTAEISHAGIVS